MAYTRVIETTFSATFTQAGGYSQTVTVKATKVGNLVTLEIPTFGSTTTANASINSGATDIPAAYRPAIESRQFTPYGSGGSQTTAGGIYFTTGGQMQVYTSIAGNTFPTATANSGLGAGGVSTGTFSYKA